MPPAAPTRLKHALSFDIEDWFHMVEVDAVADPANWPTLPSIVVDRTKWIVDAVGEAAVHATFFVLGWVAARHPGVVKTIAAAGHEIGTHSYWHGRVDQMTPESFRKDLRESIDDVRAQRPRAGEGRGTLGSGDSSETQATSFVGCGLGRS